MLFPFCQQKRSVRRWWEGREGSQRERRRQEHRDRLDGRNVAAHPSAGAWGPKAHTGGGWLCLRHRTLRRRLSHEEREGNGPLGDRERERERDEGRGEKEEKEEEEGDRSFPSKAATGVPGKTLTPPKRYTSTGSAQA